MAEQFIDSTSADGRTGLRVRFSYQGDRFGHTVELLTAAGTTPVLESRENEGTVPEGSQTRPAGTGAWPPSPPLQQLSLESNRRGERVALLLGMAGRSHWSLSVEPEPAGSPSAGFTFDVACRPAGTPSFLGSAYRTLWPVEPLAPSTLALHSASVSVLLEGLAEAEFAPPQIALDPGGGVLVVPPTPQVPSSTIRWRYRVSWTGGARP